MGRFTRIIKPRISKIQDPHIKQTALFLGNIFLKQIRGFWKTESELKLGNKKFKNFEIIERKLTLFTFIKIYLNF